jgi:hypothetical protein
MTWSLEELNQRKVYVRERYQLIVHDYGMLDEQSATANWIPNALAMTRPRTHPAPTPGPPPDPPQGPQGLKKKYRLQILYVFERSDGRQHPAHVGPRLGRPTHALYTRHEVLAYKPTTAQYPV